MQIVRGYVDASAAGKDRFNSNSSKKPVIQSREKPKTQIKASGDSLSLSPEAREMLENNGVLLSATPQDATYDQYGNMTRQFDSLQNDLRQLQAQFNGYPQGSVIKGKISSVRAQLAGIEAQI